MIPKASSTVPSDPDQIESEEESEYDLLRAITIRPVPLQKRDPSFKAKITEHPHSPEPAFIFERPTSAKPSLGFSGHRPVSGKPQEIYGTNRGVAKFSARHRGQTIGLRLVPLSSNMQLPISNTLNDSMYVKSMVKPNSFWEGRPSTSYNVGKKLPPLRAATMEQNNPAESSHRVLLTIR